MKPLEMQNGIVLSDVFGMSCRRGHFPLSLGRPGNWRTCKLEYVARRRVCTVSDNRASKVGVRIPDQLPTAVGNTMRLRGFDVAKQSLQSDLMVRLRLRRESTQHAQRKRNIRSRANHQIHQQTDGSRITSFCFLDRRFLL